MKSINAIEEINMRVDGMINGVQTSNEGLSPAMLKDLISRLSPGDVVRAQILDYISNEVLLKLFDSTTVMASVPEDFSEEIGKYTNFVVKENLPDKLVLEEVKNAKPELSKEDANILKTLTQLGIPKTDDNIKLAKTITENNLPITKEFFESTANLINSYKDVDIPKAVIMEANKIDATPASVKQLGLLEKGSISLGNELNELISMLDDATDNQVETIENKTMVKPAEVKAVTTVSPKEGQPLNTEADAAINKNSGLTPKNDEKDNVGVQKELNKSNATDKPEFNAKSFLKLVEESLKQNSKQDIVDEIVKKSSNEQEKTTIKSDDDNKTQVKKAEGNEPLNYDKKITSELKKEVEKLFVKLEDIQNDKKVDLEKNIKSLGDKLEKIKEDINALNPPNKEVLIQKADNIINQLKFIDDIKSFGYYVPIPMKLNGTLGQADLYVLKRNKNKKVNPEDATVFLALDTVNMGRVETLLLINKKTISLNVRLEDKVYEDYVKTRFIDLYNMLGKKGYKLTDIKYRRINEPTNIFNINKVAKDIMSSNSGGVDIRL